MTSATRRTRSFRRLALIPLAAGGLMLGACAPEAPPSGPAETPWLEAGCVDSSAAGSPDFQFNGLANLPGNAVAFDTGGGVLSEDGSCTGTPGQSGDIVRAATSGDAVAVCAGLGVTVTDPVRLIDFGYAAPVDAWTCVDTPPAA